MCDNCGCNITPGNEYLVMGGGHLATTASGHESVEVLRDGASAMYGSDAIAGVFNFNLRDSAEGGEVRLQTAPSNEIVTRRLRGLRPASLGIHMQAYTRSSNGDRKCLAALIGRWYERKRALTENKPRERNPKRRKPRKNRQGDNEQATCPQLRTPNEVIAPAGHPNCSYISCSLQVVRMKINKCNIPYVCLIFSISYACSRACRKKPEK